MEKKQTAMTPKEKAEQLVRKYEPYVYPYIVSSFMTGNEYHEQLLNYAKICALLAVDEVLILITAIDGTEHWQKYYEEVKQEIEKL